MKVGDLFYHVNAEAMNGLGIIRKAVKVEPGYVWADTSNNKKTYLTKFAISEIKKIEEIKMDLEVS